MPRNKGVTPVHLNRAGPPMPVFEMAYRESRRTIHHLKHVGQNTLKKVLTRDLSFTMGCIMLGVTAAFIVSAMFGSDVPPPATHIDHIGWVWFAVLFLFSLFLFIVGGILVTLVNEFRLAIDAKTPFFVNPDSLLLSDHWIEAYEVLPGAKSAEMGLYGEWVITPKSQFIGMSEYVLDCEDNLHQLRERCRKAEERDKAHLHDIGELIAEVKALQKKLYGNELS